MVSLSLWRADTPELQGQGVRPINTKTDLPALADLLEIAFANKMDAAGRAAIQQMREIGRLGFSRYFSSGLASGVRRSFVWVEGGRLLGNISIYSANVPHQRCRAWILANIAVLPKQRRRGIATQLVRTALDHLRAKNAQHIVLQVDEDNRAARQLYRRLGFKEENVAGIWVRSRHKRPPAWITDAPPISRRSHSDRHAEYELALRTRPAERGGIGWLRPLNKADFEVGIRGFIAPLITGRLRERRVVIDDAHGLKAGIWVDRKIHGPVELTLLHETSSEHIELKALLSWALRRYTYRSMILEHPKDVGIDSLLNELEFRLTRTVINMRLLEAES